MEPSWARLGCHLGAIWDAILEPAWESSWEQSWSHLGCHLGNHLGGHLGATFLSINQQGLSRDHIFKYHFRRIPVDVHLGAILGPSWVPSWSYLGCHLGGHLGAILGPSWVQDRHRLVLGSKPMSAIPYFVMVKIDIGVCLDRSRSPRHPIF